MFCSTSEKIVVSFAIISNVAVTTRVSIIKKATDLFIKGIFKLEQIVSFTLRSKTTFKLQKRTVSLTLLTKRDLNCNDFLPTNGRTQVNYFLGANIYTSIFTYKLSRYFLMQKFKKLTG